MRDAELMERSAALAEAARRRTAPNPWVGCVLASHGEVVGVGATAPPGGPHAEIEAMAAAGARAEGATAYVTLEPCAHHGRTPPCADALVAAGVTRVVVALEDPDERVAGRGIMALREGGVVVDVGVGRERVLRSLTPYLHHRRTGRAFCLVKTAMSLDGRSAATDGTSRWITGEEARADAHELRADSQAVVVGSGTALADQPALTVRGVGAPPSRPPLRVLLDGRGRVPASGPLFDPALAPILVLTTEAAPTPAVESWHAAGAKVEVLGRGHAGGVDLVQALDVLGSHDVLQAVIEGGATLHGALLAEGLVDGVVAYVAPCVLGSGGRAAFLGSSVATLSEAPRFELSGLRRVGDDVRLDLAAGAR